MKEANVILVKLEFLQPYLKDKDISQSQFADAVGVTQSTVNRVMNGKRNPGGKFVSGVLQSFNDLSFDEVFTYGKDLSNE
ncbi:helix-turn-helix transcriptional regulator [Virgibacillus dakarensis]|uniref:helix-turn-helix transcriptional regulator n=1 Tax=Virgibacillus dakarensis TaxID=1917889 RepID=UPI000B4384FF|nr:helix-turn-helix transcriptional regulator [Virgibacillus dakarensis]